jgi:hypothetical protein
VGAWVYRVGLEVDTVVETLILAAADVLCDPPVALSQELLGFLLPLPVNRPPCLHSVGTAVDEQADHPVGELLGVVRFCGHVVGGAGLLVVVGDDAAYQLGGVAAAAAAHDVQPVGPPRIIWKDGLTSLGGCSCWIGMTMGGPNEEPLGIAVLANTYWTKGQPNIIADHAGIAMLQEISAAI